MDPQFSPDQFGDGGFQGIQGIHGAPRLDGLLDKHQGSWMMTGLFLSGMMTGGLGGTVISGHRQIYI